MTDSNGADSFWINDQPPPIRRRVRDLSDQELERYGNAKAQELAEANLARHQVHAEIAKFPQLFRQLAELSDKIQLDTAFLNVLRFEQERRAADLPDSLAAWEPR